MAIDPYKVSLDCLRCDKTGEIMMDGKEIDCPSCEGDGRISEGTVEGADQISDLTDKVDDCIDKLNDILEKVSV